MDTRCNTQSPPVARRRGEDSFTWIGCVEGSIIHVCHLAPRAISSEIEVVYPGGASSRCIGAEDPQWCHRRKFISPETALCLALAAAPLPRRGRVKRVVLTDRFEPRALRARRG